VIDANTSAGNTAHASPSQNFHCCIGQLKQTGAGHSEIFTRITEENPVLLAPSDKIELINVFGRKLSLEVPSRTSWADPVSIVPPNGVTFYTDGSLLKESPITGEAYTIGIYATVFQSKVYAILA
jgi:hypothetical protein